MLGASDLAATMSGEPIAVHVAERRRVAAVGLGADSMPFLEAALAVVQQHHVHQRPVTSLGQHDVEITIAIEIAQARVGAGLGGGFQLDGVVEVRSGWAGSAPEEGHR